MGILDLLGGKPIEAIGGLIGKLYTSEGEKLSAQELLERVQQNPQLWTFDLNKLNALDLRLFNSGWRPFIGWVCGVCVGLYYIPQFILAAYLWTVMCLDKNALLPYPIDARNLMELVYLMLGFGFYRSVEKLTGTNKR